MTDRKFEQIRLNHPAFSTLYSESHAPQQQPRGLVKPPKLFS